MSHSRIVDWNEEMGDSLVGTSLAIQALEADITAAARSDAKVLITGESGVGKEVVAHLLHRRSRRQDVPLVSLNCAGVPDTLLESELFGYLRGSFTGAYRDKAGLLERAHQGTMFLDEIGEMSLRMQAMLLRFFETGELQRVGADGPSAVVDVRVICATNRRLADQVERGEFRSDLYYRLNVIHLELPPLRERPEDIPPLVRHFGQALTRQHQLPPAVWSPELMARLCAHDWPGNARELRNVVERLVVRSQSRAPTVADLPPELGPVQLPLDTPQLQAEAASSPSSLAAELFLSIVRERRSFWEVVYGPFIAHDVTRATLRGVIDLGLRNTQGRYTDLTGLFNMPRKDYKRFLSFLKKHDCLVPFHQYRASRAATGEVDGTSSRVA